MKSKLYLFKTFIGALICVVKRGHDWRYEGFDAVCARCGWEVNGA